MTVEKVMKRSGACFHILSVMLLAALFSLSPLSCAPMEITLSPSGGDDTTQIQNAIASIGDGGTIYFNPGHYYANVDIVEPGKSFSLVSHGGPEITILDGNGKGRVMTYDNTGVTFITVEGFTITNGRAQFGGGVYCSFSSPTISNCIISNCTHTSNLGNSGGGMYNYKSSPTISNCTFSSNIAGRGGGMYNSESSPTISDCNFKNNTANSGGGMYNSESSPTISDCNFKNNTAKENGGGMYNHNSSPTISNCTFSGNTAQYGGGMYNYESTPTISDCTFSGNTAKKNGGGLFNEYSSPTLTSCTFFDNNASIDSDISNTGNSNPTLINCIIKEKPASTAPPTTPTPTTAPPTTPTPTTAPPESSAHSSSAYLPIAVAGLILVGVVAAIVIAKGKGKGRSPMQQDDAMQQSGFDTDKEEHSDPEKILSESDAEKLALLKRKRETLRKVMYEDPEKAHVYERVLKRYDERIRMLDGKNRKG